MKLKLFLSALFIIITGSVIVTVIFWLNYPYKPLRIMCDVQDENGQIVRKECPDLHKSFEVEPKTVISGQTVTILIHYCKDADGEEYVSRDLVGETIIINVPPKNVAVRTPIGCADSENIVRIPRTINPGTYYLQYTVAYQVNPIRKIEITFASEPFTIMPLPETPKK